jgi:hypothetical protein
MTSSSLVDSLVHLPPYPVRLPLVGRLADDLRAATAVAMLAPSDVRALDAALRQVMNGWNLSVSRFLRVQDDVESVLVRASVDRPLVDRVLVDLEDVFLALWNWPSDTQSGQRAS